ncbi:MAG: class I SAM-dependent methyltransferase [Paracoccaceae bacterium]
MIAPRLAAGIQAGLDLSGEVAVMRPPTDYGVPEGAVVQHGFKPDADAHAAMGRQVVRGLPSCDVAVVVLPRSRALGRDMIARACATARRRVVIDGARDHGIDAIRKALRKRLDGAVEDLSKAHGRLIQLAPTDLSDWRAPEPAPGPHGWVTDAGVFSEDGPDDASALLAQALPPALPGRVVDLGAGWGYLSAHALRREGVTALDLVEAEARALDCARRNVADPRAAVHWADATAWQGPADHVVTNPPFHQSRKGEPALGAAFIATAARILNARGTLWLVANRHLPYEAPLHEGFAEVEEVGGDARFKVIAARRPRSTRRRA